MTSLIIRDAMEADLPAVTALYAHHVLHGVGTFEEAPPSVDEMAERRRAVAARGLPWLVAEDDGRVLGYCYAAPFRTRAAYRYVAEDAIYVAHDAQGRGVGQALLLAMVDRCTALGLRQLMAVIGDRGNDGSIRLHASVGFERVGVFRDVGYKHGRWLDIVLMQKPLNGGGDSAPIGAGLPLG